MKQYIDKNVIISEIKRRLSLLENGTGDSEVMKRVEGVIKGYKSILSFIDTLEVKEINIELENENNNTKITTGTKIRSKTNPNVILSIISNDCHEDEFECSNGSVLSLKQIEKYYDIIK